MRTLDEADPSTGWLEEAPAGALDRRLLVQDRFWIDPWGRRHRLEDLTDEYRSHILETLIDMELERWSPASELAARWPQAPSIAGPPFVS